MGLPVCYPSSRRSVLWSGGVLILDCRVETWDVDFNEGPEVAIVVSC